MTQAQEDHLKQDAGVGPPMAGERSVRTLVSAGALRHGVDVVLLAGASRPSRTLGASSPPPAGVRLAPVHVMSAWEDLGSHLEIVLASGDRVRISDRVSVETLRGVVQVHRAAC